MTRRRYIVLVSLLVIAAAIGWLLKAHPTHPIDSYATCTAAGYPVTETEPPVCRADNRNFIGPRAGSTHIPAPVTSQPFSLLVHGDSHGNYPDRQEVIRTPADWQGYWRQVHAQFATPPPLLPVDFRPDVVIALSYGPKPTSGYGIKVSGITTSANGTTIDVVQTVPGEGCIVTAAQTNPYFIAKTATLPDPITFRKIVRKHQCP